MCGLYTCLLSMLTGVGIWWKGQLCSERRKQNVSWTFNHVLRPCCYSLKTQCKMMSHEQCTFLEGVFFFGDSPKTEHCSLVSLMNMYKLEITHCDDVGVIHTFCLADAYLMLHNEQGSHTICNSSRPARKV